MGGRHFDRSFIILNWFEDNDGVCGFRRNLMPLALYASRIPRVENKLHNR